MMHSNAEGMLQSFAIQSAAPHAFSQSILDKKPFPDILHPPLANGSHLEVVRLYVKPLIKLAHDLD